MNVDSTFKKSWETLKFFLLLYQFFYLPLKMCIFDDVAIYWYIIDKSTDFILFIDIFLNFLTPVYVQHEKVYNVKMIAKSYLKGWFCLDLISILPFEEVFNYFLTEDATQRLAILALSFRVLRFARISKLIKLFRTLDFKNNDNYFIIWMQANLGGTAFFLLLPNFLVMSIVMHIFACIWYVIALDNSENDSWIVLTNFQDKPLFDKYLISLYFIVQTFTTTGYGDVKSQRTEEIGFRILMMCIAVLMYGLFSG